MTWSASMTGVTNSMGAEPLLWKLTLRTKTGLNQGSVAKVMVVSFSSLILDANTSPDNVTKRIVALRSESELIADR